MGLFGGKKPNPEADELPIGRRRPVVDDSERRPQAFSYYAQRSGAPSSVSRAPLDPALAVDGPASGHAWWQNRTVALLLVTGVVVLAGFLLYVGTTPKVITVTGGGNAYFLQDTAVYQQAVAKKLSSSLLNRNKLTVDASGISSDLERQYPEIARSTISVPIIGQQPIVRIEPNRPSFILTTTDSAAFLLDEHGRALVSASQITSPGELSVPTLQDLTGSRVTLGQQALPSATVTFVEAFLAYLKAEGVEYSKLVLPSAAAEIDVYIKGTPYFVKANLMGEARLQAGTFLAAKGRLEKDKVVPAQYIDVRVPERAYYK
jgi:hypothetical protein